MSDFIKGFISAITLQWLFGGSGGCGCGGCLTALILSICFIMYIFGLF